MTARRGALHANSDQVGRRRKAWTGALVVGVLAVSAGCAAPGTTATSDATTTTTGSADLVAAATAAVGAIAWKPCGPRLECAKVEVPFDWEHPKGKQIKLAVIRHLASNPAQRKGSIFFNPGARARAVSRS